MAKRVLIIPTVVCGFVLGGCVAPADDAGELELRSGQVSDTGYPGDEDVEVRQGDRDDPDAILWDLDGGNVSRSTGTGGEQDLLVVESDALWLADSAGTTNGEEPVCTVEEGSHPSGDVYELVDADGSVVFTMWGRFVFAGEPQLPDVPLVASDEAWDHLVMSFVGKRVHAGAWWDAPVLAEASAPIAHANPVRRLVVAALLSNECGLDAP